MFPVLKLGYISWR